MKSKSIKFSVKISNDMELFQRLLHLINRRYDVYFYIHKTVPAKKGWDITIKTDEKSVGKVMWVYDDPLFLKWLSRKCDKIAYVLEYLLEDEKMKDAG